MTRPAPVEVKENFLDRVISAVSPERGARRMKARLQTAVIRNMGGYTGASKTRRSMSDWRTSNGDADSDINPHLGTLRERSRDQVRNNGLVAGACSTSTSNVVGTGLRPRATIDADFLGMTDEQAEEWEKSAEREFKTHAETTAIDAARTSNFYDLQDIVYRAVWESGDVFPLLTEKRRAGSIYSTAIQVIEGDLVSNENNKADTDRISGGIKTDASRAPVSYFVSNTHPGSTARRGQVKWTEVPAFGKNTGRRNMLHLYRKRRPGQSRGVPEIAPVLELLKQLGEYTDAEVMAAVVSGMFTVFIKTETGEGLGPMGPTGETGATSSDDDVRLGNGAIVDLASEESIESANPGRPNAAFDPFVLAILRLIGTALEIPFELLVGHFTASYSAARAALLQAWKSFRTRRQWLALHFCQPVYEAVIDEAVLLGRLSAPGYFADPSIRAAYLGAEWDGDAPGQLDPLRESKANVINEEHAWKAGQQITTEVGGGDMSRNIRRRGREAAHMVSAGLKAELSEDEPDEGPLD